MRYFVAFSYFGKMYHGWQNQPNAITVQETLEKAFSMLLKAPIDLLGAGRTDTGVHARQMYAHWDFDRPVDLQELCFRLNACLPDDIAVQDIFEVPADAHARFGATARTYEYWVVKQKDPFYFDAAHWVRQDLDVKAMNEAAALLLGQQDFECFSRTGSDVKTFICKVTEAHWDQVGDRLVFTISADRFLRNMVRAVVGTLLQVGKGKWPVEHITQILQSKDRSQAGPSVPAKGLYLTKILYPKHIIASHEQ